MAGSGPVQSQRWRSWFRRQSLLPAALVIAFLHGLFYVVAIPPWDLFDEEQHLAYVLTLRDEWRIPHVDDPIPGAILESAATTDRWGAFRLGQPAAVDVDAIGLEGRSYEAYQPPLTYALLAPVTAPAGADVLRSLYLARLAGAALFTSLVGVAWALARQWFPDGGQAVAASAALTLAAIPAAAQSAGRVSNDLLAAVLISAGMLATTRLLDRPCLRTGLSLGALGAAALVTKSHGALLLPLIALALVLLWRQRRLAPSVAALALLPGCVAALAWSAFTYQRYGVLDGSRAYLDRYQTYQPLSLEHFLRTFWLNSWSDYWGAYRGDIGGGWLLSVTNLALITLIVMAIAHALRHQRQHEALVLVGVLALEMLIALVVANHTAIVRPGGRLLLPLYPALTVLIAASWRRIPFPAQVVPVAVVWALSLAHIGWWFLPFFYGDV
ncbi:MAG TPA: DUF2142 domain-containing protein [Thermomicrobiales bacterium]|nr:DUF2142 domain-containing protein [Thermomicrobiales bacterium]